MTPSAQPHHESRRAIAAIATALLFSLVAASAWGAIATDAIMSGDLTTAATSVTSQPFSTLAPNELLLAFVATDGKTAGITVTGVTGAGLTWAFVRRTNVQLGTAEIWRAFAPATLSGVTVRAALSQTVTASITVVSFSGTDTTGTSGSGAIGATASANAKPGAPSATLVTTRANSWVWGVGNDWDSATPRTPGANQSKIHENFPPVGDTYWVQRQDALTANSGTSVTINDIAPTNDRYNLTLVEVLPPAAPQTSFTISGSITPAAVGVGTLVTLTTPANSTVSTTADAAGNYRFPGLANGSYTVTPTKAGYFCSPASQSVTVNGVDVSGVNFTIATIPTYRISGTISPPSAGAGTIVTLSGTPSAIAVADASGNYTFTGLPLGSFTVTPSRTGFTFGPASTAVTLSGADATGIGFSATALPPTPVATPDLSDLIPSSAISIVGTGTSRVLQYTHDSFNGGTGPLVIQPIYRPASGNYQGIQYLYARNGGAWTLTRQVPLAGAFEFDAAHGHFHYPFATYGLYAVAVDGGPGTAVALSAKDGFCIDNSFLFDPLLPYAGAFGPLGACSNPTTLRGLDVGAVDEYDATDEGQSISLNGVPDGTYWLRAVTDPENYLTEGDRTNNETDVKFTITGNTLQVLQTITPSLPAPPTVTLDAPLDGSALAGTVTLAATSANATSVQFMLDGFPLGGVVSGPTFALPWNTTTALNGIHWLAARAKDATGRINTSGVATIQVANSAAQDTVSPVVAISDPEPNEVVSASVSIGATAADNSAVIDVQFYVDGAPLGAPLTSPPYFTFWNTLNSSDGPHTVSASAVDSAGLVGYSAPVSVVVDNSHPPQTITRDVTVSVDGNGLLQTPPFTTPTANDLLLAFVSFDGPSNSAQTATVSGAGLNWAMLKRSNVQHGTAEIWAAKVTGTLTNATVLAQPGSSSSGSLTVIGFTHSSGTGVVGQTSAPSGEPDIYMPGIAAGSWVFAVANDWSHAAAPAPVGGQTIVHQRLDATAGASYWVQSTSAPSTAFALVDIHDTAPVSDQWNYAGVEIVATRPDPGNTPPVASIQSPANNAFYYTGAPIHLLGTASDLQTATDSLSFQWTIDLVFGGHTQPSFATFPGPDTTYAGADYDDGTGVHQVIKLTARDPGGLVSDPAQVSIWPEIDLSPSAVTVTPDTAQVGQSAHFAFTLSNAGRMPAQASRWMLRAGNTLIAQGSLAVAASGTADVGIDAVMPTAGSFALRLSADSLGAVFETDESNNVTMRTLVVNPGPNSPPVANAVAVPASGPAPLLVTFSGVGSTDANGDSLHYSWNFGDGGSDTLRRPSHTYLAQGNYTAILTVTDGHASSDTASVPIQVSAPLATFPVTPVLDTFTRTGAVGPNWTDQPASFTTNGTTLAPTKSTDVYLEWSPAVFDSNQEVFVTLSTVSASAQEQNLMLKGQGNVWTAGHIEVSYVAAASKVVVYTFTPPSTWRTIGTISPVQFANGNQFGARALSTGAVQVFKNGTLVGSVSAASWAYTHRGGRIGVSGHRATAARFDNFGGGTIPANAAVFDVAQPLASRPADPIESLPGSLSLSAAFPNPTNAGVSLRLALPKETDVRFDILDIQGREIWGAAPQHYAAGRWTLAWDGRTANGPAGPSVYLAKISVGTEAIVRRFVVVH